MAFSKCASSSPAAAPSLPEARGDVTCAAGGGKGYAIGGYYDPSGNWTPDRFMEHVFELDVAGGAAAWTNKTSMPVAVGDKAKAAEHFDRSLDRKADVSTAALSGGDLDLCTTKTVVGRLLMNAEGSARAASQVADILIDVPSGA